MDKHNVLIGDDLYFEKKFVANPHVQSKGHNLASFGCKQLNHIAVDSQGIGERDGTGVRE